MMRMFPSPTCSAAFQSSDDAPEEWVEQVAARVNSGLDRLAPEIAARQVTESKAQFALDRLIHPRCYGIHRDATWRPAKSSVWCIDATPII